MTRALLVLVALSSSGCGLFLDGVYLISDKRFSKDERQTRPTEHVQDAFEHTVRAEQGQVWLACEDTRRAVERVWTVHKEYEHVNGWHQVHWLPVVLDAALGGGLGIGFGIKCGETGNPTTCLSLIAAAPFVFDLVYSAIRLATIEPPKLVNKERRTAESAPGATPLWRQTVSCEPDAALVVGRSEHDPVASWFRVDAWGALNAGDRQRLVSALLRQDARLFWAAGGSPPVDAKLDRCAALQGLGLSCPPPPSR